jgi:opacity protein-like surface antigen
MKRFFAGSVLAVALFAAAASAQTQFGGRLALSGHQLYSEYVKYYAGLGYGGGAVVKQTFSDELSLQAEASFSYRNLYYNNSRNYISEMAVSIPVMVNWYIPGDRFKGYVIGGLQADIPFSSEQKYWGIKADISKYRSAVDIGIIIGAGYVFPGAPVGIDARYVFNFNEPIEFANDSRAIWLMSYTLGLFVLF